MKIHFRWKRRLCVIQSGKTTNTPTDHSHSLMVMFVWFPKTWAWPQLRWRVTLTKPSLACSGLIADRLKETVAPETSWGTRKPELSMILQALGFSEVIWYHLLSPEDQQVRGSYPLSYFECLHNYIKQVNLLGFSSFLWDFTLYPPSLP